MLLETGGYLLLIVEEKKSSAQLEQRSESARRADATSQRVRALMSIDSDDDNTASPTAHERCFHVVCVSTQPAYSVKVQ